MGGFCSVARIYIVPRNLWGFVHLARFNGISGNMLSKHGQNDRMVFNFTCSLCEVRIQKMYC